MCWLCSFLVLQISLQNFILCSKFGILSPCFSLDRSLCTCFRLTKNSWFCLNCEILCSYILTFVFFAINQPLLWFFNNQIYSLFLHSIFSIQFLNPFPLVSPYFSLSSLLISLLRLVISLSVLLYHHGSFLSYFSFLHSSFFCNPNCCYVWVTSSVSVCLITAFTFLVTSLNFLCRDLSKQFWYPVDGTKNSIFQLCFETQSS